jgi:hypothetical protein
MTIGMPTSWKQLLPLGQAVAWILIAVWWGSGINTNLADLRTHTDQTLKGLSAALDKTNNRLDAVAGGLNAFAALQATVIDLGARITMNDGRIADIAKTLETHDHELGELRGLCGHSPDH